MAPSPPPSVPPRPGRRRGTSGSWRPRSASVCPPWSPAARPVGAFKMTEAKPPGIRLRQAVASDAQAIGAVFDAAVRVGWTYLGELASRPMFTAAEWDKDVADHAPPNVLLVGTDEGDRVIGFTAAHPQDCEMYLLFV